jgi:hypothetical protein
MMMFCANNSKTDGAPGALLLLIHHKNKKSKKRVNFARGRETRKARSLSLSLFIFIFIRSDRIILPRVSTKTQRKDENERACLPFRMCCFTRNYMRRKVRRNETKKKSKRSSFAVWNRSFVFFFNNTLNLQQRSTQKMHSQRYF